MQLSRIKRMSEKRQAEWIKAIEDVYEAYQEDRHKVRNCPFCDIGGSCEACIWWFFEGMTCSRYAEEAGFDDIQEVGDENYKGWKALRLRMLRKWKKILKEV